MPIPNADQQIRKVKSLWGEVFESVTDTGVLVDIMTVEPGELFGFEDATYFLTRAGMRSGKVAAYNGMSEDDLDQACRIILRVLLTFRRLYLSNYGKLRSPAGLIRIGDFHEPVIARSQLGKLSGMGRDEFHMAMSGLVRSGAVVESTKAGYFWYYASPQMYNDAHVEHMLRKPHIRRSMSDYRDYSRPASSAGPRR